MANWINTALEYLQDTVNNARNTVNSIRDKNSDSHRAAVEKLNEARNLVVGIYNSVHEFTQYIEKLKQSKKLATDIFEETKTQYNKFRNWLPQAFPYFFKPQ